MTTIELKGELGVANAEEIRKLFVSAVEKNQPIVFDVTQLEDIDVSIVQLLYALFRDINPNCSISFKGTLKPLIKKRLFNIGVASSPNLSEHNIVAEIKSKLRVLHE